MKPEELLLSLRGARLPNVPEGYSSSLTVGMELDSDLYSVAVRAGLVEVELQPTPPPNLVVTLSTATLQLLWGELGEQHQSQLGHLLSRLVALEQELATHLGAVGGSVTVEIDAAGERHLVKCTLRSDKPGTRVGDCSITCSLDDLRPVLQGLQNPLDLLLAGKLKLRGEPGLLMLLSPLFTDDP